MKRKEILDLVARYPGRNGYFLWIYTPNGTRWESFIRKLTELSKSGYLARRIKSKYLSDTFYYPMKGKTHV